MLIAPPSFAESKPACPQVLIDTAKERPLMHFINIPNEPNSYFYTIVTDTDKKNWEHLTSVHGFESNKPFGWIYFIIADKDIAELAPYKFNRTRGAAPWLPELIPQELSPDSLEEFPKVGGVVNICSLSF